jgi:P27 family predicted phage terminase small subunit
MPSWRKRLAGVRPSRIPANEPTPPADRPPKPAHLSGIASEEWDRLAQLAASMEVLTAADGPLLEACACAYAEYRAALAAIAEGGAYYNATTAAGATMVRQHPAVAGAGDAWRRYLAGLSHFGLSPATRSKVAKAPPKIEDPFERWRAGSRRGDSTRVLAALEKE